MRASWSGVSGIREGEGKGRRRGKKCRSDSPHAALPSFLPPSPRLHLPSSHSLLPQPSPSCPDSSPPPPPTHTAVLHCTPLDLHHPLALTVRFSGLLPPILAGPRGPAAATGRRPGRPPPLAAPLPHAAAAWHRWV